MDVIIDLANKIFKPVLEMGGPIIMLIILTVLALLFGVKFSKALEGGIKLAIALTGIGAIIGMLNGAFSASLAKFVENTGIQLNITDVGWAHLQPSPGVLHGPCISCSSCSLSMWQC